MRWKGGTTACATVIAALALVPNVAAAGGGAATASVSPASGYAGAKLVATYSFTPKGSCSASHSQVSWSFGNTVNWATSPAPSATGTTCTGSTPSTAPPAGATPGSYRVCGLDAPVSPTAACATYTIKPSPPTPTPRPSPSPKPAPPSPSPSPSPHPSGAPVATGGTPSPSAPPGSAPPGPAGGGGANGIQRSGDPHGFVIWPWVGILFLAAAAVVGWRFRSWLIGVFENVEVMGKSGADLETELLHHEASPEEPDATPADASPPAQPEVPPTPDPDPLG